MAVSFTVTATISNLDSFDIAAADRIIAEENAWRASQDPPLSELPNSTNAEKKSSLEAAVAARNTRNFVGLAKSVRREELEAVKADFANATAAQQDAILAAIDGILHP